MAMSPETQFRWTKAAFFGVFALITTWIFSRYPARGWPLVIGLASAFSALVNLIDAVRGPKLRSIRSLSKGKREPLADRRIVRVETDTGAIALCDPGALRELEPKDPYEVLKALEPEMEAGNLLLFNPGAAGEYRLLILTEEEVPQSLMQRSFPEHRRMLLRLPTGVLKVVPVEDLPRVGRDPGAGLPVPAGTYSVLCFNVEDEEVDAVFRLNRLESGSEPSGLKGGELSL
jgi:hypothetical protein